MNAVFFIFQDALERYRRSGAYEGTYIDKIFIEELKELTQTHYSNIFRLFMELTYMYVRYTSTNLSYYEIPVFLENTPENPTLFLISHLRSTLAFNILDFYEQIIFEATNIVNTTLKEKVAPKGSLLNLIRNFKLSINPEEKFVDLNVSFCEISEYMNFVKKIVDGRRILDEDLEFIVAVSLYFGYVNRSEIGKWEDCSSFLIKVFNLYTNDAGREEGALEINGFFIYEIFKNNASIPKKCLKDVNLWVLSGYKFKLDEMCKEYEDVMESIERDEYSEEILMRCENNARIAVSVYNSFLFLPWSVSVLTVKYVERIVMAFRQASIKILQFKD